MKKFSKSLMLLAFAAVTLSTVSVICFNKESNDVLATYSPGTTYTIEDPSVYYSSIDSSKSGTELLSQLQGLNSTKRKHTIGYSGMSTGSDSSAYIYTDYDPSTVKYDGKNQPYGTSILSFYSGRSTTTWNREHVWPDSRGGGSVDGDIFMTRPTIQAENSDRGNSSYVEGKAHSVNGWDPVTAFEKTLGVYDSIRGECARIIFYCVTANSNLKIKEGADTSYNNSIGSLSDMLKWNIENPVNERERNRQSGGQYLQGNRNAFVDHPEYACKIWGNTNDSTKKICSVYDKTLTSISMSGSPSKTTYYSGEPFNSTGLTITAYYDDNSSENVTSSVTWTTPSYGSSSVTGTYSFNGVSKQVIVTGLTVLEATQKVTGVSLNTTSKTMQINETLQLNATVLPSDAQNKSVTWSTSNSGVATVSNTGLVKAVSSGSATITVTTVDGGFNATCNVVVTNSSGDPVSAEIDFRTSNTSCTDSAGNKWTANSSCISGSYLRMEANGKVESTSLSLDVDKPINIQVKARSYGGTKASISAYAVNSSGEVVTNVASAQPTNNKENPYTLTLNFVDKTTHDVKIVFESKDCDSSHSVGFFGAIVGYTPYSGTPTPKVNSLELPESITINLSSPDDTTITPVVDADSGASYTIIWSSSDTSVATVSGDNTSATIKAKGVGTTNITASIGDLSAICEVTVTQSVVPPTPDPKVNSISLPKTLTIDLNNASTGTLVPTVNADEGATYTISWSSSNTSVATVSGNNSSATVTGVGEGTSTITATIGELSASCEVTVIPLDRIVEIEVGGNFKTDYKVGETFDPTGLVVTAHHLNGTDEDITDAATIGDVDTSTVGEKTVEVTYLTFKTSFSITVLDKTVNRLILKKTPAKVQYFADEPFNPYGAVIQAVLEDEYIIDNVVDQCNFEYNFEESNVVRYSFGGKSSVFAVVILTGEPTVEHKAADFAYTFNEKLEDVEAKDVTLEQWDSLKYDYNKLDDDSKAYLKTITPTSGEGEVSAEIPNEDALKQFAEKYDAIYLANKDKGFIDFIGRNPTNPVGPINPTQDKPNYTLIIIIVAACLVVIALVAIIVPASVHKLKQKNANKDS